MATGVEVSKPSMEIRFQPALLQEVIDSFIEKTEREGDPTYYKEFHELADPIYEKFTLDDREAEFKKLYQYLFGIWGFSDIIRDAFNEFPELKQRVHLKRLGDVVVCTQLDRTDRRIHRPMSRNQDHFCRTGPP